MIDQIVNLYKDKKILTISIFHIKLSSILIFSKNISLIERS